MADKSGNTPLAGRAVTGLAWGVLGGAVGKLAGFLAQIYLGRVLSKEDFALFAIATSCSAVLAGLVNGGTQRVLIQRGQKYDEYAYVVLQISFIFNFVAMGLLAGSALPVAHWFNAPALAPMLAILGVATFVSTPGYVLHAKLIGGLRFSLVQCLAICSHVIRYGTTILFAFIGLGPLSFVLPLMVIAITDTLFAFVAVRRLPPRRSLNRQAAGDILKDSRWIMLGAFAGALILNGDNLAVGVFSDKNTLGIYFFAFQLTFAAASLIGGTLESVVMPTLVSMADDPIRQRQAFTRALSTVGLASSGMAMALVIVAPLMVHSLWETKWDEAIPAIQLLSLAVPALLASWIARASIEARGGWALITGLSIAEGLGTVIVAAVGAAFGGLITVAATVSIFKVVAGLTYIAVAARKLEARVLPALMPIFSAYAAGLAALAIGWFTVSLWHSSAGPEVTGSAATAIVFSAAFASLAMLLCRSGVNGLCVVVGHIRGRLEGSTL